MPSYYVSSYTANSITVTITPEGDYNYFKVYCRTEGGTELENTWIAATATRNYTIYGLSPSTTYVVNVGYHTNATDGTCTWMGAYYVTTFSSGSGGGGGGTGDYYYYASLSFNANGGSGAPSTMYGESLSSAVYFTIPNVAPTRSGYTFLGWSFASDSTEGTYKMGASCPVLGSTTGYNTYTLYAVWQSNTQYWYVTLTLNANGGSGGGNYIFYGTNTQNVLVNFPSTPPKRDGYSFVGWSTSPTGAVTHYAGQSYYMTSYADYPGTNYTFYAIWEEGGGVRVYNGGWKTATPYVYYNGQWVRATPYIYNGGWKRTT